MVNPKAATMSTFIAFDIFEKAEAMRRAGEDVVLLAVGEPDFPTPEPIVEACVKALREGKTRYTHSHGILPLREAIAEHYHVTYGVTVSPDQIFVTAGTSAGMQLFFAAWLTPGDEVILPNPTYPCYPNFISFYGGTPVWVNVDEEEEFQYRPDDIRAVVTPRTTGIFINSPSNPTGMLMTPERLQAVAELGPLIISDEIYHGLVYQGEAHSILEFTDNAVVFNGFSKTYAMTGWRVGYCIVPPSLITPMRTLQQNFNISINTPSQYGALAALTDPDVAEAIEAMRTTFDRRRRLTVELVRDMGLGVSHEPHGAFYVFANAQRFTQDSYTFAFDCLEHARVGVTPGVDFGSHGEGYLRLSYAVSEEHIEEGCRRLKGYLDALGGP